MIGRVKGRRVVMVIGRVKGVVEMVIGRVK